MSWIDDFEWGLGWLRVKKTGKRLVIDGHLLSDVATWFRFYFEVRAMRPEAGAPFRIAFTPDRVRPWYLAWGVTRLAGGRIVHDPAEAEVLFHFQDATLGGPPAFEGHPARRVNFACDDVSKTRVTAAFERVAGYGLEVDPETWSGPAVEKGEANGVHDGRIIQCPAPRRPGQVYQRLIDNRMAERPDLVEDLRTPLVGGKAVCVFLKRRPVTDRFANTNVETALARPEDVFTPAELALLEAFALEMGMDFGGVDVLRDRADGRIYVVDANKTDMGPPLVLPLSQKRDATRLLARAFRAFISRPAPVA